MDANNDRAPAPGLKQGHPVQVNAQEARDGNKLDKDTARNRKTVGLHVGTHKDDGPVDTVQAVEDSSTEDCANAYFRNQAMIMNATGSATKAKCHDDLPSVLQHEQHKQGKRSHPVDPNSGHGSQSIRNKRSRKQHRNEKQSQSKPRWKKGVSPDAAW